QEQRSGLLLARAGALPGSESAYAAGKAEAARLLGRLRQDSAGTREAPLVARAAGSLATWQGWGEAEIGEAGPLTLAEIADGEGLFTHFRADFAVLLGAAHGDTVAAGDAAGRSGIVAFLSSIVGSVAAAGVLVFLVLRIIRLGVEPV